MEPSTLEMWITNTNPGLTALPSKILGYLDVKSLANCRVLSSTFREFIDGDYRQFLCLQLDQAMHVPYWTGEKLSSLHEQKPEWKAVFAHLKKNEDSQILQFLLSKIKKKVAHCGLLLYHFGTEDHNSLAEALLRSPYTPTYLDFKMTFYCGSQRDVANILKFTTSRKMDIHMYAISETLLHMASACSEDQGVAIAEFLLKNAKKMNLNVQARNYFGESALQVAEKRGKDKIATLIRNYIDESE